MAKRKGKEEKGDSFASVPGGLGGRVIVPVRTNKQGIDYAIDPAGIYSGMVKRQARQNLGHFSKPEYEQDEE